jgi:hypothetical protein
VVISTPFIVAPIPPTIYWCSRCGDYREAPAHVPLMCCGELMYVPENQAAARRLMEDG